MTVMRSVPEPAAGLKFCPECGAQALPAQKFCAQCGTALAARAATPAGVPLAAAVSALPTVPAPVRVPADLYAPFWSRVAAFVLDFFVVVVSCAALNGLLHIAPRDLNGAAAFFWLTLGIFLLYKTVMEGSKRQATLGKLAFGLRVTTLRGKPIGFGRALVRNLAQVLSALPVYLGFVMASYTQRRQALHDMLAGTLVIRQSAPIADVAAVAATDTRPAPEAVPPPLAWKASLQPDTRPELPIKVSFRDSLLGPGKRAILQNLSDTPLAVIIYVHSPETGAQFRRAFFINAHCYGQIGQSQGWPFVAGQKVTISNPLFQPIEKIVA
jgi:uncharacterized RDD family membrane protein YckC